MRISMWQQFSSNHSSSFTVAGKFEIIEHAHKAAEAIRAILRTLLDWYEQHENAIDWTAMAVGEHPATPIEQQTGEQYGIAWNKAVDWVVNLQTPNQAVSTYNNYVFVSSVSIGEKPFDELMAKLGAQVFVREENSYSILVSYWCACFHAISRCYLRAQSTTAYFRTSFRGY